MSGYPPAIAPTTRRGSFPTATSAGKGESADSCERSFWHAKKRMKARRFFACQRDYSLQSTDAPLPDEVAKGAEPLLVIGAIAGG